MFMEVLDRPQFKGSFQIRKMLKRLMQMRNLYEILAERQCLQNIEFMFPYLALVKLFSCLSQNLILIHVQVFRKHLEYLDI